MGTGYRVRTMHEPIAVRLVTNTNATCECCSFRSISARSITDARPVTTRSPPPTRHALRLCKRSWPKSQHRQRSDSRARVLRLAHGGIVAGDDRCPDGPVKAVVASASWLTGSADWRTLSVFLGRQPTSAHRGGPFKVFKPL